MALSIAKAGFWTSFDFSQRINGGRSIQSVNSTLSILHSEHKSYVQLPLKWNTKGCKSNTHTNK